MKTPARRSPCRDHGHPFSTRLDASSNRARSGWEAARCCLLLGLLLGPVLAAGCATERSRGGAVTDGGQGLDGSTSMTTPDGSAGPDGGAPDAAQTDGAQADAGTFDSGVPGSDAGSMDDGGAGACTPRPLTTRSAVCSAATSRCIDGCSTFSCIAGCMRVDPAPACRDCPNNNFFACYNARGCQDEWDCWAGCAAARGCDVADLSDISCMTTQCPDESARMMACAGPHVGESACGLAWVECADRTAGGDAGMGEACGPVTCDPGQICCNSFSGICTPPGGICGS